MGEGAYPSPPQFRRKGMITSVIEILQALGILPAIQFMAVASATIFLYRYFTRGS